MGETKKPEWVPTEYSLPSCDRQGGRMTCDRCGFDGPGSEGCGTHMCVHPRSLEELSDRTEMLKANGFLAKDKLDLDAWSALAEAATPGPWEVDIGLGWCGIQTAAKQPPRLVSVLAQANARFCAAAREAVPALIARVRELEAVENRIREKHGSGVVFESLEEIVARMAAEADHVDYQLKQAEARVRELEAEHARLNETIIWNTPYPGEAKHLSALRAAEERAEKAEARVKGLEAENRFLHDGVHRAVLSSAASEREACANVCDVEALRFDPGYDRSAKSCAQMIRKRGAK